ncbi:MAG: tetratricopeptide repeat protein [Alistipes sp.]|jgi:tetratricopeptide (TPR) repeat protein|nr:tetratricopeptide repeat protein [Alistipes sp.]
MKKLFFALLGAALVAAPALRAQDMGALPLSVKAVNAEKLKAAIEKSKAETADAKKGAKSATWIKLGDAFLEAERMPVNGLYSTLSEETLKATFGQTTTRQEEMGGATVTVYPYEHFTAWVSGGQVQFFLPTTVVDPAALDNAYDAYDHAYTMDAKSARKVADGMENIRIRGMENGGAHFSLSKHLEASADFRRAYRASVHPAVNRLDTIALFYAGMTGVFGGDYENAIADLDRAIETGYEADGETYRLKFLALYNLDRKEESLEVLKKAVAIYPANEDIIDMLLRYYAENEGDPTGMIPMVEEAIAQNPDNANLYQGLARIYDKLNQVDNAIASIRKAVAIVPEDFLSNYLEGLYIVRKGDAMNAELGNMAITSRDQYQSALAEVNAVFASALPALEKAYSITPSEIATVELIKNLTFRLRDDEAMNQKYEKYNALFESMSAAE